jgi:hypothetical protein
MIEDENLDKFINQLIEDKKLGGLTAENRPYIIEDLRNRVTQQVYVAVLDALPDKSFDEFEKESTQTNPDPKRLQEIILNSGVDSGKIIAEALVRFRSLYIGAKVA